MGEMPDGQSVEMQRLWDAFIENNQNWFIMTVVTTQLPDGRLYSAFYRRSQPAVHCVLCVPCTGHNLLGPTVSSASE